jgi:hypothetical protein
VPPVFSMACSYRTGELLARASTTTSLKHTSGAAACKMAWQNPDYIHAPFPRCAEDACSEHTRALGSPEPLPAFQGAFHERCNQRSDRS